MENLTSKMERWEASGIQVCPECASQRQQLKQQQVLQQSDIKQIFFIKCD